MKRPTVNISPAERFGRIVLGGSAAIAGVVLIASGGSALAVVLLVLLVLAGLDLVVTGSLGHCPLYAKLGHVPRSPRLSH
jgi:Inner membrane protein YgaP-like, transmembrane domain